MRSSMRAFYVTLQITTVHYHNPPVGSLAVAAVLAQKWGTKQRDETRLFSSRLRPKSLLHFFFSTGSCLGRLRAIPK